MEFLVKVIKLNKALAVTGKNQPILQTDSLLIYEDLENKKAYLLFIKPLDEMSKAVGILDYNEWDKEMVKDKYWLSISIISI